MVSPVNNGFKAQKLGVLHHEKIFKNYNVNRLNNPWFCGLANTVINSYNYFDESDRRLFNKFNGKTRELADFSKKYSKKTMKVFPSKKLNCGWIDYPNLEYPDKTTGIGLRRIQGFKSNCPLGSKKPFRLESLPENLQLKGKAIPIKLKLNMKKDSSMPSLPRWVGIRPDITVESNSLRKPKKRPLPNELDCWIRIPYTLDFFDNTRNFETGNFLIHELLKPHKLFLSEGDYSFAKYAIIHDFRLVKRNCTCPTCIKATKARTIIDATTNWLGFTNKEIGAEKLVEIIAVFTGNTHYQEYYSIEEPSKAIVVKQTPIGENIILGINGEPVSHSMKDFTILSEINSIVPFASNPEYNKNGREVIVVAPSCDVYIPLSWDEQVAMDNIKILYGHGKNIQRSNEMYQPATVANETEAYNPKKYLPKNPEFSERSILEVLDWFSFCKLTRSLIRSTPHFTQLIDKETFNLHKLMIKGRLSDIIVETIRFK